MNVLPEDAILCLGVVNAKLRDFYSSLDLLCEDLEIDKEFLIRKMTTIDYEYDESHNQFV